MKSGDIDILESCILSDELLKLMESKSPLISKLLIFLKPLKSQFITVMDETPLTGIILRCSKVSFRSNTSWVS
ncbi:unnamed protein product [Ambrosiozyma monospora]|uniref:Unnamed protein product n=1 Tax=Ambrosiozyma monospora TaxID=43982 RepID=A0ACB5T3Y6_AMBMO|nr:unnamed protein product [Ambrosiozyma monospora]